MGKGVLVAVLVVVKVGVWVWVGVALPFANVAVGVLDGLLVGEAAWVTMTVSLAWRAGESTGLLPWPRISP